MIFLTKGEFIQALKDYDIYIAKIDTLKEEYRNLYYLRYEKIKSPLDYDVIGYDKNNEPIRQIKMSAHLSDEQISKNHEILDNKIEECLDKISDLTVKKINVEDELNNISKPLKSILITRYLKHKKLKYVCEKYSELYLDEAGMHKYIMRGLDKYYEN